MTSIRPVQSIIANLTKDVDNNIGLILDQNESLHNYHLKPTKISALHNSKIIIMIDKNFEIFLRKILSSSALKHTQVVEIAKLSGMKLLSARAAEEHHHDKLLDYHLWLDVSLVKNAAIELEKLFAQNDPLHAQQYQLNLANFVTKLDALDQKIKHQMKSAEGKNFIVTHNAYQYFINRYGLKQPRVMTLDHDHTIGAHSFLELKEAIQQHQVTCIFEEPQFNSTIITKLTSESKVKLGILDAEWGDSNSSVQDAYFVMMEKLADNFVQCLAD